MDKLKERYPKLSEPHLQILSAKDSRVEAYDRHVAKGGKTLTFLPLLIGDGYKEFWNTRKRYRVVEGSRASKKTVTVARNFIYNMMRYPDSNLLVIRKVGATNKDSTYAELKKAIYDLKVESEWKFTVNPLEITYKPTGQKVVFRGLDDPQKISGVTVAIGHLCWVWIEESYEMKTESEFDFVDESIRGILPDHLWYQLTLSLNPWNKKHWIKKRFFDPIYGENEEFKENPKEDRSIYALSTNYFINEFIDDSFKESMMRMKENNPKRYHVAGLGNWGITSGLVFEHWKQQDINVAVLNKMPGIKSVHGLDWGFSADPTAFIHLMVDEKNLRVYAVKEMYKKGMTNKAIAQEIKYLGYDKQIIIGDSSEPKSIEDIFTRGIRRIRPAKKGNDSVRAGIDKLQDYEIIADPKLTPNFCTELDNYMWDADKPNTPVDDFNHLMDAFRYACEDVKGATGTLGHKILSIEKKEDRLQADRTRKVLGRRMRNLGR